MARNVRVLAVCGSCDPGSKTMKALRLAAGAVSEAGADVEVLDLRDYPLPILFSPHAPSGSDAAVDAVKAKFREADALLIGSPEYHGSYSGALKNLLDLMGFEEFEGKMVALVGVAGGAGRYERAQPLAHGMPPAALVGTAGPGLGGPFERRLRRGGTAHRRGHRQAPAGPGRAVGQVRAAAPRRECQRVRPVLGAVAAKPRRLASRSRSSLFSFSYSSSRDRSSVRHGQR